MYDRRGGEEEEATPRSENKNIQKKTYMLKVT
jgi:hypothetical protein